MNKLFIAVAVLPATLVFCVKQKTTEQSPISAATASGNNSISSELQHFWKAWKPTRTPTPNNHNLPGPQVRRSREVSSIGDIPSWKLSRPVLAPSRKHDLPVWIVTKPTKATVNTKTELPSWKDSRARARASLSAKRRLSSQRPGKPGQASDSRKQNLTILKNEIGARALNSTKKNLTHGKRNKSTKEQHASKRDLRGRKTTDKPFQAKHSTSSKNVNKLKKTQGSMKQNPSIWTDEQLQKLYPKPQGSSKPLIHPKQTSTTKHPFPTNEVSKSPQQLYSYKRGLPAAAKPVPLTKLLLKKKAAIHAIQHADKPSTERSFKKEAPIQQALTSFSNMSVRSQRSNNERPKKSTPLNLSTNYISDNLIVKGIQETNSQGDIVNSTDTDIESTVTDNTIETEEPTAQSEVEQPEFPSNPSEPRAQPSPPPRQIDPEHPSTDPITQITTTEYPEYYTVRPPRGKHKSKMGRLLDLVCLKIHQALNYFDNLGDKKKSPAEEEREKREREKKRYEKDYPSYG